MPGSNASVLKEGSIILGGLLRDDRILEWWMFIQMILIINPQELEDLGLIQTSTTLIVSHFESWTNGSHVPLDSTAWSGAGSAVEGPFVKPHGGRNHLIPQQKY